MLFRSPDYTPIVNTDGETDYSYSMNIAKISNSLFNFGTTYRLLYVSEPGSQYWELRCYALGGAEDSTYGLPINSIYSVEFDITIG